MASSFSLTAEQTFVAPDGMFALPELSNASAFLALLVLALWAICWCVTANANLFPVVQVSRERHVKLSPVIVHKRHEPKAPDVAMVSGPVSAEALACLGTQEERRAEVECHTERVSPWSWFGLPRLNALQALGRTDGLIRFRFLPPPSGGPNELESIRVASYVAALSADETFLRVQFVTVGPMLATVCFGLADNTLPVADARRASVHSLQFVAEPPEPFHPEGFAWEARIALSAATRVTAPSASTPPKDAAPRDASSTATPSRMDAAAASTSPATGATDVVVVERQPVVVYVEPALSPRWKDALFRLHSPREGDSGWVRERWARCWVSSSQGDAVVIGPAGDVFRPATVYGNLAQPFLTSILDPDVPVVTIDGERREVILPMRVEDDHAPSTPSVRVWIEDVDVHARAERAIASWETMTSVPPLPDEAEKECDEECVVCADKHTQTVFLPCGHACCCKGCSERMDSCPVCREMIVCIASVSSE
jgi:hypothetical protein